MTKIMIITDSTAYIEKKYAIENNVKIVPLVINFNNRVFKEGYPDEIDTFYDELEESNEFPKTSQPPVGEFKEVFELAINQGYEVIVITLSSHLSGTYNSAMLAAQMVDEEKITVIDSLTAVSNLKHLVYRAVDLVKEGKDREFIVNEINSIKLRSSAALTVESLEYLKRGGRLSNAQALIGSILNIKPIIGLIDGKLLSLDKVRGKKKAIQTIVSQIPENAKKISVCHIKNIEEAMALKDKLQNKFPNAEVTIDQISPVIGSHLGPKMIGATFSW